MINKLIDYQLNILIDALAKRMKFEVYLRCME